MLFGMEKLEWCGYLIVKNFDAVFIRFDRIHERDRLTTNGQQPKANYQCNSMVYHNMHLSL